MSYDTNRQKGWGVVFYLKSNNRAPAEEYLKELRNKKDLAQVVALVDKLRDENGQLPPPFAKHVEKKIWELRARFGGRVFYFTHTNNKIVLLDGVTKKQDKIKQQDMERVRDYYRDYQDNNREKKYDSKLYH